MTEVTKKKTGHKRKTTSRATAQPHKAECDTTIQWGLYRRNGAGSSYTNSLENDCLLEGNSFDDCNPVTALENAFSSIAQVISELQLTRGTEVRVSVRKRG